MAVTIKNPYRPETLPWLKGNLHAHTTNSDGRRRPQAVVDEYAARGYGFLMISDHDVLTDPAPLNGHGMTLIPGNEVTANGPHVLHINAHRFVEPDPDRQIVLNAIIANGALAVIPHPNWERNYAHCPQDRLEAWQGYIGIELYNGVVRRLDGSPLATDRWDRLLGGGRRVWGFAHDDSHAPGDDEIAWIAVQSPDRRVESILDAIQRGAFYASTGVTIHSIRVCGRTISVQTENAQRIVVHSDYGHREATADGTVLTFTVPESCDRQYVRFECWGAGESMAWTQPFYIERD